MTDRELMQQALEVLEFFWDNGYRNIASKQTSAMEALRAAIEQAQPERQPVQESALTHNHLWIGELYGREKNT